MHIPLIEWSKYNRKACVQCYGNVVSLFTPLFGNKMYDWVAAIILAYSMCFCRLSGMLFPPPKLPLSYESLLPKYTCTASC